MNSVFIKPVEDDGRTGWTEFGILGNALERLGRAANDTANVFRQTAHKFEHSCCIVFRSKGKRKAFIRSINRINYQHYQRANGYKRIPRKIKKRIMKGEIV